MKTKVDCFEETMLLIDIYRQRLEQEKSEKKVQRLCSLLDNHYTNIYN